MKTTGKSLRNGGPYLGLSVMYPAAGIVERIGAEWDWIWIDCQHGQLGYQDMLALVRACDLIQRAAIVRVGSHEPGTIGSALDAGASGVIVPMVNSPEDARAAVQAAKFPPLGERSFGGRRVIDRYGRTYAETANLDTLLIVQIETPEALKKVDAIASVPGVDALFYGPDDIMLRIGGKMNEVRPKAELEREIAAVARACQSHDKLGVNVGGTSEMLAMSLYYGYNLIVGGGDSGLLAGASKQRSTQARTQIATSTDAIPTTGLERERIRSSP